MKTHLVVLTAVLASASVRAQQPGASPATAAAPTPAIQRAAATPQPVLEIWQIDLQPSGQAFSFGQPKLDGDAYVFTAWPDRQTVRLAKAKVKKLTSRTKDVDQMSIWVVELLPKGRMTAKEQPALKNGTYVFRTWRDGTLMSLRQSDVKSVQLVRGVPAFRIQQEERGAALNANLPMQGTDDVTIINAPPQPAPQAPADSSGGNWSYQGEPGITDAYGPPNAVVAAPGDAPKAAPTPAPQPPN